MLNDLGRGQCIARLFQSEFGDEPELWARAPGRVDLMGSHTDYNMGHVLTVPINRDTWIAARERGDRTVRVYSANLHALDHFSLASIEKSAINSWSNYVRGVASAVGEQGLRLTGFDAVLHSTVPLESGLSSSAALECASAVVFQELGGWDLKPEKMALLCQKAENQFVGVKCGILDQCSSCLGKEGCTLLLDCRSLSTRTIPIAQSIQIVICDTRSRRRLSEGEYARRRTQCEEAAACLGVSALRDVTLEQVEDRANDLPAEVFKRARFIVMENGRVLRMAEALAAGDKAAIGVLCAESFEGARDLYEICSPVMLAMREAMMNAPGAIGARQAGAGFGGCMVALVEAERTEEFRRAVSEAYQKATGVQPETYPVEAAAGAGLIDRSERLPQPTASPLGTESR